MKKLLIMDPLSPVGHIDINKVIVNLLADRYDVTYFASENYRTIVSDKIKFCGYQNYFFDNSSTPLNNRVRYYKVLKAMINDARKVEPYAILLMSYDIFPVFLLKRKLRKLCSNVFLFNHSNIDEYERSKIKKLLFKRVVRNFKQILYDDFIKEFVDKTYHINSYVARHNKNTYKLNYSKQEVAVDVLQFFSDDLNKYIVSVGGQKISQSLFEQIVDLDKSGFLKNNNVKIYIKSKQFNYNGQNAIVQKRYLTDDEYSFILDKSGYLLLGYDPEQYKYRVSGVYFDAITFNVPLIYTKSMFFQSQSEKFAKIGIELKNTIKETIEECLISDYDEMKRNISIVSYYYDDTNVLKDFEEIIG